VAYYRRSSVAYSHYPALIMPPLPIPQTPHYTNETTWCYIPEGFNLHTRRHENLKSHKVGLWLELSHKNGLVNL
jgi:hypothetical protein